MSLLIKMSEEERLEKRAKRILKTISKELLEGEIVVVYSRIYGVPIKNVGFYNPRRSTPTNLSLSIHKIGPGDIWPVGEGGYIIRGDTIESIETKERGVEELSFYFNEEGNIDECKYFDLGEIYGEGKGEQSFIRRRVGN